MKHVLRGEVSDIFKIWEWAALQKHFASFQVPPMNRLYGFEDEIATAQER